MSERAEVSPGKRPMTLVRRRTSTNILSRRFVVLIHQQRTDGTGQGAESTRSGSERDTLPVANGCAQQRMDRGGDAIGYR
jgi:hypothetical protein